MNLFDARNVVFEKQSDAASFRLELPKLTLQRGRIIAIVGASGSGKSTLLNILTGLEGIQAGSILFETKDGPLAVTPDSFEHARVGRIFQQGHLISAATVAANLAMAMLPHQKVPDRATLAASLSEVDLPEELLDRRVWQLSGGQQQRVAVARALLGKPELLFADEPTSSLDPDLADDLMKCLKCWREKSSERAVLWVTHNYHQAVKYAQEALIMRARRNANGTISSIIDGEDCPRPMPATADKLHDLVSDGPDQGDEAGDDQPDTVVGPKDNPNGWPLLAGSIAAGLIFSNARGIEQSGAMALAPMVSLTSAKSDRSTFEAARKSFAEGSLLLRLVIAALLFNVIAIGWFIQQKTISRILKDPGTCHVMVAGARHLEDQNLTTGSLLQLSGRIWRKDPSLHNQKPTQEKNSSKLIQILNETPPVSDCSSDVGAWPRRDTGATLWVLEGKSCQDAYSVSQRDAQIIGMHRNEPVLSRIPTSGAGFERASDALLSSKGKSGVILSDIYISKVLKTTTEALQAKGTRLCVGSNGKRPKSMTFLGVSKSLPRDDRYFFDAVIRLTAFEKWQRIKGDLQYQKTALYFEPSRIDELENYLRPVNDDGERGEARFIFDPEALSRLSDSLTAGRVMQWLFFVVGFLTLSGTALMTAAATASLITANTKPLAMQIAIGLNPAFLREILIRHALILTPMVAITVLLIGNIAFLAAKYSGLMDEEYLSFRYSKLFFIQILSILAILIISILSVIFELRKWYKNTKIRLAVTLQSG